MNKIIGLKVLILDSNSSDASRLAALIEEEGHEVHIESDPAKASETVKANLCAIQPFDVIFLDYYLPGTDGVKVSQDLSKIDPFGTHIFITFDESEEFKLLLSPHLKKNAYLNKLDEKDDLYNILNAEIAAKKKKFRGDKSFYRTLKKHIETL